MSVLDWATPAEVKALADRIEANRLEQLAAVESALQTILKRIGEVEELIAEQPKFDPSKPKEEQQSSGGFVPFSARKRNYERMNRKELTPTK